MRPTPIIEGPLFYLKLSGCIYYLYLSTKHLHRNAETSVWWVTGDSRPGWHVKWTITVTVIVVGVPETRCYVWPLWRLLVNCPLLTWHTPGILAPGTDCGGWGWLEEDDLSDWGASRRRQSVTLAFQEGILELEMIEWESNVFHREGINFGGQTELTWNLGLKTSSFPPHIMISNWILMIVFLICSVS